MGRPPSQPFAQHLSGQCARLFEQIQDRHDRHLSRGYLGYLCYRDIAPAESSDADADAYVAELGRLGVKRLTQVRRDVARTWNRMAAIFPSWPSNRLSVPDNLGPRSLPWAAFPATFETDARAYLDHEPSDDDLFAESNHDGFADATRVDRARKIRSLATIAVECGVPPASLRSLNDLIDRSTVRLVLRHLWKTNDKQRNGHAANFVRLLRSIAKYEGSPADLLEDLTKAHKKMRPEKSGMTNRNRAKLRRLMESQNLQRVLQLAEQILESVDTQNPTITDATLVQVALCIAILLSAPMRIKNLVGLHDRHIDRVSASDCYIVIPADEVKNKQLLHYKLPPSTARILDIYRERYRPLLLKSKSNSPALFISRRGKQKGPAQLSIQITKLICDQTGLDLNPHLFRHLAGYIYLKDHPGEYESVRQLLGHKLPRTTVEFYTGLEVEETFARYDEVLDRLGRGGADRASP